MQCAAASISATCAQHRGRDKTVLDDFLGFASGKPDDIALVSYLANSEHPRTFTYGQLAELVDRLAAKLIELGVKPGDFVSYQFPNRWEFAVAHLATIRVGAISNPIMPIYGKREIRFMLERTKSRLCIGLMRHRKAETGAILCEIQEELETLEHVILVDDSHEDGSLEHQLGGISLDDALSRQPDRLRPHPDDIEMILFSSGTTGEPKGILHSFNSAYRATSNSFERMEISEKDVVLMVSPLGHATGFNYGLDMPLYCGCKFVYQENWDPEGMLSIIERERISWTMASAAFARDLCKAAEGGTIDTSSFRYFACGGAPIPPSLAGRAREMLGVELIPCWGMTEAGITTLGRLTDSDEQKAASAGFAVNGVEVRVVDDDDRILPPKTPGSLQLRASGQHVGYFMNEELYRASFKEGWFRTGDLGEMDEDGYVRIVGRSKDIVIRGGENIPIIEIENMLLDLPEIADIVIVGVPDERLGERCHAVILPGEAGDTPTLALLTNHLAKLGVTKQYWPEFLTVTDSFPRTSTGKIQRFVLRDQIVRQDKGDPDR